MLATHDEFARSTGSNVIAWIKEDGSSCRKSTMSCNDTPNDVLNWSHGTGVASI